MGKFNEIQQETTQSWGGNSFTTTVKENTVEFDSAKDKFTFKDAVEVPSLSINGEPITPTEPQVQADWNQNDDTKADYIKNRICYDGVTKDITNGDGEAIKIGQFELDYYPQYTRTDLVGKNMTITEMGQEISGIIGEGSFALIEVSSGVFVISEGIGFIIENSGTFQGMEFNIPGFYATTGITGFADAVTYVIEDMPFTKKIDDKFLKQSDWNQNDSSKASFVKNRTHFDTGITTQYVSESFEGDYSNGAEMPVPTSSSKYLFRIKFDDQDKWEEHEITFSNGVAEYDSTYCDQTPDEYSPLIMLGGKVAVSVFYYYNYNSDDEHEIRFEIENSAYGDADDPEYEVPVEFEFGEGELKKLDPKFIPDNVVQKWELGGTIFRIYHDPEAYEDFLQFSFDNGENWKTVAVAQ